MGRHIIKRYLFIFAGMLFFLTACHHKEKNTGTNTASSDSLLHTQRIKSLSDSIRQHPDSASLYYERGSLLYVMKSYKQAGKDIQKAISLNPLKAAYYLAMGELYVTENHPDSAKELYRKALQLEPASLRPRLQLAYILLEQEHYSQTIKQTDTLLQHDPQMAPAYGLQSQAYQALGDTTRALKIMKKAVSLAPRNYEALMAMGDLLLRTDNEAALQYYEKAQKADTSRAEPSYCIGLFYEKQKQTAKAIAAYNNCISRDAYYSKAYFRLGNIYKKENKWEKAWEIYNLAIQTNPVSSKAWYQRGLCSEEMKHTKAAINDYEQALVFDKNNQDAQKALDRLKKINS